MCCIPEAEWAFENADGVEYPCLLPGVATRKVRMNLPDPLCGDSDSIKDSDTPAVASCRSEVRRNPMRLMTLATPSSRGGASVCSRYILSPTTPDPNRADLKLLRGDAGVAVIIFDFDGTLTATRGEAAQRAQKSDELRERASVLRPWLQALRDAGMTLGIMSKSTEQTIREALKEAALCELFEGGPLLGKAVGFDGKAGFIEDFANGCFDGANDLEHLGAEGLMRVLLVDDDVRELERARDKGIQTYPAPEDGGLQDDDFEEIFELLHLSPPQKAH